MCLDEDSVLIKLYCDCTYNQTLGQHYDEALSPTRGEKQFHDYTSNSGGTQWVFEVMALSKVTGKSEFIRLLPKLHEYLVTHVWLSSRTFWLQN